MRLGTTPVLARWTGRDEGDLAASPGWGGPEAARSVESARRAVVDRPWSWVRQVHGRDVVMVDEPGGGVGEVGDALVSAHPGACLAVFVADCAAVALASPEGVMGAVHAGWRGLVAGVLHEAVAAMSALGATDVKGWLGPCIHAGCYEFSPGDLDKVARELGPEVRGSTDSGHPALDVPAAVRLALAREGAELVTFDPTCTACSPRHFSHRAALDKERQALVVWRA